MKCRNSSYLTEQQLLDFAHQYLQEMGYAEPGQPWLIYAHHDTDNTHLHIVTSRVAPDGRKIQHDHERRRSQAVIDKILGMDRQQKNTHLHIVTSRVAPDGRKIQHDHERRRSQAVIDKILGMDRQQKTDKDIEAAKLYCFSSFAQFTAVLGTMGYEVFQKDGNVFVKQGGRIKKKLPLTEIETLYKIGYQDKARNRKLRAYLKKYRDECANKEEVQKEMKKSFGSFAQFKAVMGTMGYEVFQKDGNVFVKQGGRIQKKLPLTEIEALFKKGYQDKSRNRQLRAYLKKYRDVCANKEELQKEMKKSFGVDVVFFGKKDKPYGYMLIDHANKTVIHGARVLAVEELLDFATPEQRFDRIEAFIDQLLTLNPKTTQGEIFL